MIVRKIFGPPGTGKTTRLLDIMESEIKAGVRVQRIAYLTFTVAARQEARDRARQYTDSSLRWFRTIHSATYAQRGLSRGQLISDADMMEFGARAGYEFTCNVKSNAEGFPIVGGRTQDDELLMFDHLRRHRMMTPLEHFNASLDFRPSYFEVERFTQAYALWKADNRWLDFTDLLEPSTLEPLPVDVVIVDEAQDLSRLQWAALWRLAENAQRVYLAGDDDQAIYEWAGADPRAFLDQPGEIEVLPTSHRCPKLVTELAQSVISRVSIRQSKEWKPRDATGEVRWATSLDALEVPRTGTVRYLTRNHVYNNLVTEYLRQSGVPYAIWGKPAIRLDIAEAILGWERLRKSVKIDPKIATDVMTWMSPIILPNRVASALPLHLPWYDALDKLPDPFYIRKVIQNGGAKALTTPPRVSISTIHAAKGVEADHVILLTEMSPVTREKCDLAPDIERRVWYVGITRAKETLTLVGTHNHLI
jgi:DNA helicase-2/ATP-dependent DNA helicase PcrA